MVSDAIKEYLRLSTVEYNKDKIEEYLTSAFLLAAIDGTVQDFASVIKYINFHVESKDAIDYWNDNFDKLENQDIELEKLAKLLNVHGPATHKNIEIVMNMHSNNDLLKFGKVIGHKNFLTALQIEFFTRTGDKSMLSKEEREYVL